MVPDFNDLSVADAEDVDDRDVFFTADYLHPPDRRLEIPLPSRRDEIAFGNLIVDRAGHRSAFPEEGCDLLLLVRGLHRILFRFSPEDYTRAGEIWNGPHPEDGQELTVSDDIPKGSPWPDLDEEPQLSSPGVDPDMMKFFADKLGVTSDVSEDVDVPLRSRATTRAKKSNPISSASMSGGSQ